MEAEPTCTVLSSIEKKSTIVASTDWAGYKIDTMNDKRSTSCEEGGAHTKVKFNKVAPSFETYHPIFEDWPQTRE